MPISNRNKLRAPRTGGASQLRSSSDSGQYPWLGALLTLALLAPTWGAHAQAPSRLPERNTFYLTPTIEGIYSCDEGLANPALLGIDQVNAFCAERMLDGSAGITRLLDELEPGGPKGQVQVGYLATLQLMAL